MEHANIAGQVYRCLVCGAEVSVIRDGEGKLVPHCCNQPMHLQGGLSPIYRCPICGSEVMVIRSGREKPTPRCCNQYMQLLSPGA
jgi:desulfoferrodoxin-like iron-binding protein